jgi:hypothetical protein
MSPKQYEVDPRIRVVDARVGDVLKTCGEFPMPGTPADADMIAELNRGAEHARRADARLYEMQADRGLDVKRAVLEPNTGVMPTSAVLSTALSHNAAENSQYPVSCHLRPSARGLRFQRSTAAKRKRLVLSSPRPTSSARASVA